MYSKKGLNCTLRVSCCLCLFAFYEIATYVTISRNRSYSTRNPTICRLVETEANLPSAATCHVSGTYITDGLQSVRRNDVQLVYNFLVFEP